MPTARKKKWPVPVAAGAGVLAVALGLLLWLPKTITRSSQVHPFSIRSLAVLPLQNFSEDPEQEYFADGMTEALITKLSMIKDLRVISKTSTMRYKKTEKSLPEIARDLKVDAITQVRTALDLDPLSLSINQSAGAILRFARQYDRSIEQLEAAVALDPGFAWTYWSLGVAFTYKTNYEKALEAFERSLLLAGENMALIQADEACAYALWGKAGEARRILAGLQSLSEKKYVSPYSLASVYAALGEKDEAFLWLEKACEERANSLVFLKVDPRLDGLRSDERLESLLDRVGLGD